MSKKRIISLVTTASILASFIFTGCSNSAKQTANTTDAAPVKKELKMLTNVTGGKDEQEMKLFNEALNKATGLKITIEKPASDYDNALMQKLQSGEKYDLVYFGQDSLPYLVNQGALTDITDYVKKSKILSDTNIIPQSEWDAIKVNGKLYAGFNKKEVHRVVNVNSVIAQKAGVDVANIDPTLDGYYQAFKKMKDYNDNTAKVKDFYPINISITKMHDMQPWFSSLGLKGGIVLGKDGKKTVPWSTDEAAPVWDWLRKLYAEGLMDKDALTDTTKELRNKFQTGKTGEVTDWAAYTGLYNKNAGDQYPNNFKAYPLPGTKGPDGNYMLTKGTASLWGIPANAENIPGAVKVLEYFATQEGGELLSVGIEGSDYNKVDGKYVLTESGKKHAGDHGAPLPINSQFKNPIGWNPGFEDAMKYIQYSKIEDVFPETPKYKEIIGKNAVKIIKGDVSTKDGLAQMRAELKQAGVIQ
ncbi:ABC transporter substrate-binding protein [Clostridium sp. DJ247]|uniref:ABC transporter substrate-binding protein n=1 Tax=Clostridium sp. DJ247 TaxID=2726188 RepID=UPI0016285440|nr:ABC transporter substrate-binding protein [Clostridium sp. DJ247]MBC2582301.1 ABC transporter substrate-binding protein [Clostridium sp. DJ247]